MGSTVRQSINPTRHPDYTIISCRGPCERYESKSKHLWAGPAQTGKQAAHTRAAEFGTAQVAEPFSSGNNLTCSTSLRLCILLQLTLGEKRKHFPMSCGVRNPTKNRAGKEKRKTTAARQLSKSFARLIRSEAQCSSQGEQKIKTKQPREQTSQKTTV